MSNYQATKNTAGGAGSLSLESATLQARSRQLGFWFFLAGECALFASFIGTYLTLAGQHGKGPGPAEAFDLTLVFVMTFLLLTSSLTSVISTVGMQRGDFKMMHRWLTATILLGLVFLAFQIYEFIEYSSIGLTMQSSPFGSAFYALVGFHGLHVLFGLIWLSVLKFQSLDRHGFTTDEALTVQNASKFYIAGLYWHFVDVVWVVIFTVVYLLGRVG